MCSDADMMYAPKFVETLLGLTEQDVMVESRTMYLKDGIMSMIYSGEIDPEVNLAACKVGRIKKRTTAGGCQCMHIDAWNKIRGYDEAYIGWGSEDYDLLTRAGMSGLKIKWMGESVDSIMLFHQPHFKTAALVDRELNEQYKNKQLLNNIKSYAANPNGWGGIYEQVS
jgi:hypothetical protein